MSMKTILLTFLACFVSLTAMIAQCEADQSEISFSITCTSEDCAFSVAAYSTDFSVVYFNGNYNDLTADVSDQFCIPSDECLVLYMYYNGFDVNYEFPYSISKNGIEEVSGMLDFFSQENYINCPSGSLCNTPAQINGDGTFTTVVDDMWYSFTAPTTGLYHISTCSDNTCDTKIWVYETCPWNIVEGPPGTYAYNDNANCGLQADTDLSLEGGVSYLIRIGDNLDNCTDPITFTFAYAGLISGCMDPLACNYNPLAQTEATCIYYPNPDCSSPDLVMNVETLLTSLYVMDVQATACDVEEGQVTGDGNRSVITFSVRIDNIGEADYYIGNPADNPEMFEVVNCHGHTHYAGYGDYRLMDMQGNIIPAGHKNGFCVMDLCGFGQYNCGQMGISAGCFDQYGAGTSGQWFDVTDVPDGTYRGLVTVNPLHLPDALGRQEFDYDNNTYIFCFDLYTATNGTRAFTLLSDCPSYYDCLGVENGIAQVDCEGVCDGPSVWGDVVSDASLNSQDLTQYLSMLSQQNNLVTTCNDLSANGSLTVYDLALANMCMGESTQGGNSACNFPHNILSMSGPCGMAITNVNFQEGYVDVELKSGLHDVIAYQFTIDGIVISNVVSLSDGVVFPCAVGFNPFTNSVFAMGEYGHQLNNTNIPYPVCRIYYSQVIANTICITGITDIVNAQRSRTASYIYGDCFDATAFSTNDILLKGEISVMPNPVSDLVTFTMNRFVSTPKELVLRDHIGKLIQVIPVPQGSHQVMFDMSILPSGIYTVSSARNDELSNVVRLMKL